MFHERASGERLDNQTRGRIMTKMQKQKEMKFNVQTHVLIFIKSRNLMPEIKGGKLEDRCDTLQARMEVQIQWSLCSQCFQQSLFH